MAQASFVGDYAVGNWTTTQNGFADGSVDTSGAPASILIIELDAGDEEEGDESEVTFTIAAAADGTFSFDWSFDTSPDNCCSAVTVYNDGRSELFNGPFPPKMLMIS
jgi:hypothetical protein